MKIRRWAAVMGVLALVAVIGVLGAGTALAQTETPSTEDAPEVFQGRFLGGGFGCLGGGSMEGFDAVAEALNLTPTELFEELHSGKTLSEIAEDQGVDLQALQDELNEARVQAMRERIEQAVEDGDMTQEQADWLLEGLENGYLGQGHGLGFGFGRGMMRGGMHHGFGGMFGGMRSVPSLPESSSAF